MIVYRDITNITIMTNNVNIINNGEYYDDYDNYE